MTARAVEKKDSSLFKIPLDPSTLEKLKACKHAEFPLCLRRSFVSVFNNEDEVLKIATKAGYVAPKVDGPHDVWDIYLKLLSTLSKEMGNDVIAVVESQVLKEIESLECTECPIYEMEIGRNRSRFMERHC